MTVMEITSVLVFTLAFYTAGLIMSRKYNYVTAVSLFGLGLGFDIYGTWQMYDYVGKISTSFHGLLGYLAIFLIALVFLIGLSGVFFSKQNTVCRFRQLAPWTYGIWALSSINGGITHTL